MNSLDNVQLNYASWCNRIIYFVGRILVECHVFQKSIHDLSLLNKFAMNNIRIVNKTTYTNFNLLKKYSYLQSWYLSLRFHRFFQNFQPLSPLSIVYIYMEEIVLKMLFLEIWNFNIFKVCTFQSPLLSVPHPLP